MTFPLRPTKEMAVAALALLAALLVVKSRLGAQVAAGPLPRVAAVEAPEEIGREAGLVAEPRLLEATRTSAGRDPFAAADIWEDATPAPLPLPPEPAEGRIVPVRAIAGGKVRAPRPPRIAALPEKKAAPAPDAEEAER